MLVVLSRVGIDNPRGRRLRTNATITSPAATTAHRFVMAMTVSSRLNAISSTMTVSMNIESRKLISPYATRYSRKRNSPSGGITSSNCSAIQAGGYTVSTIAIATFTRMLMMKP
uniref:Uncharacterized protein n=1 Tax=Anopheles coluzzii TaxID=1518534 RepID=A0A8W7PUH1_ANOCL